jgi:hypothetical protein
VHEWKLAEMTRRAEWLARERDALISAAAVADRRDADRSRLMNGIFQSWSWRLTAPLRAVAGWWRRE